MNQQSAPTARPAHWKVKLSVDAEITMRLEGTGKTLVGRENYADIIVHGEQVRVYEGQEVTLHAPFYMDKVQ